MCITFKKVHEETFRNIRYGDGRITITQYGSTVYIGMAMVVLHYSHT